ncbi:electron transfer flavoprotein subunit beta/FixA family protein [bacterium]|nr:electron transfer flavoprotein subunit beta/FixA family protein [bacterium]
MKIAVIVKEVPDTEAVISLKDGKPDLSGVKWIVNPYDEYAVEEAVRTAENKPGTSTVAVMVGNANSRTNLIDVLALGIDEAVLIADPALEGSSPLAIAKALAAAVKPLGADVILAGRQGVDYDWGITGIALAQLLDIAHVGIVSKLELGEGSFRAESEGDEGKLVTEGALPAVFTTDKGINEPRYKNLKGIMAAKKKTITEHSLSSLGLSAGDFGVAAAGVELVGAAEPPKRQGGRIIEGDTAEAKVANLVKLLREEAKVL